MRFLYVGIGGSIGSLLRYFVYQITLVFNRGEIVFLGTLLTNLFGAFALGWVTSNLLVSKKIPDHVAAAIGTGLIGSFTTFSTLSVEFTSLIQGEQFMLAIIYIFSSMFGGLFCAYYGYRVGQKKVVVS
jgi:fluoride exporter